MSDELLLSTQSRAGEPALARPRFRARCTIVWPRSRAAVIALGKARVVVGRAGDAQVSDSTVSRAHAAITWDDSLGAHVIEDLASHNGTSVDGQRIHSRFALRPSAVLRFGDVLAVYEPLSVERSDDARDHGIFGRAAAIEELRAAIEHAASDLAPTLIVGETGVGKERVAHAIHHASSRTGRFVAVNCAAIASQLVESHLFGHAKGAFTGATEAREGLFRAADGGSILLDEIGDLPVDLQAKLLRAIESREVLPVGATRPVPVAVKVLAATHRDLRAAMAAGTFRADLYGRLSLREVRVATLRERAVDVLDWLDRFGSQPFVLHADAAERLLTARWPLNLRAVDRLARSLEDQRATIVTLRDLPPWIDAMESGTQNQDTREKSASAAPVPSREEFVAAYHEHAGSVRALAKRFGRDRRQIYRWVEAFGLARER